MARLCSRSREFVSDLLASELPYATRRHSSRAGSRAAAKNDGAFTVAIATQVEKFAVAAREILMTESLAKNDISSLMMMRKRNSGAFNTYMPSPILGSDSLGGTLSDGTFPPPYPAGGFINNENFGVQAVRQVVDAVRTLGESPAKLVEAIAVARDNNLPDIVAALEKKLGVVTEASTDSSPGDGFGGES